ncbi:hypothetical protein ACRTAC_002361 [Clostridium perfringens]
MYLLRQTCENNEKTFEYINIENNYEFNQMKYYNTFVNKYRIFKVLFENVTEDFDIFKESLINDINNPKKIGILLLNYINSVKKFEEKSKKEFNKLFEGNILGNILKKAHNNKSYNLIYNMRNYDEHIGSPITSISTDINGNVNLFSNIDEMKKELKSTGWKKLLDNQFSNDKIIEINKYIYESYKESERIYKQIYEYIILEESFLTKFCVKLYEFFYKYKDNNEIFALYFCDEANFSKLNLSNKIDIIFIKELLFAKRLHITDIEFKIGEVFVDNDIKYINIAKKIDIINKKIIDQCFVPACLNNKDIEFILENIEK